MGIYIVRVERFEYHHVKVRADNEEVARLKAEQGIGVGIDLTKTNVTAIVIGEVPPEPEKEIIQK